MMNHKTPAGLHAHIHVVVFDDTSMCEFGENTPHVKSLETVRFYDSSEATYLCEITPSYTLYYVDTRVTMQEHCYDNGGDLLPEFEQMRDNLECEVRRYEEEVTYMHCHDVDALAEKLKAKPYRYVDLGAEQKTRRWMAKHLDNGYDGFIESISEHLRCNAAV